ncbi:uncharacterized protein LTR77_001140 [Saxophila tyrrhenica]|uniref:Uncharacterized protein n=1 Tax=Saxophila tyrrhenica TaxID=1690608 RepID=A0AAV9PK00_9PEZI|nr:hypothetical protein LTR77_001140 [Saxophila tyrrhenica]
MAPSKIPVAKKYKKSKQDKGNMLQQQHLSRLPLHQQEDSRLMQLAQELRNEIYEHLFCATRFASGMFAFTRNGSYPIVSATDRNGLSILRCCRRVHNEIGSTWLGHVLFLFTDPRAMLDKLCNIPSPVLGQIRNVRVTADKLMLPDQFGKCYGTARILKLLPGLNLDVLTVLDEGGMATSYETLNMLIRHGIGWKELRFISRDSRFLGYGHGLRRRFIDNPQDDLYLHQPQPSDWQQALELRDGIDSSPSVIIYRTNNAILSILMEWPPRMRRVKRKKEVMVVVKRGVGVDYAELQASPYLPGGDIRQHFPGKPWKELQAWQEEFHESDEDDGNAEEWWGLESYTHVDDYIWPTLHESCEDQEMSEDEEEEVGIWMDTYTDESDDDRSDWSALHF